LGGGGKEPGIRVSSEALFLLGKIQEGIFRTRKRVRFRGYTIFL